MLCKLRFGCLKIKLLKFEKKRKLQIHWCISVIVNFGDKFEKMRSFFFEKTFKNEILCLNDWKRLEVRREEWCIDWRDDLSDFWVDNWSEDAVRKQLTQMLERAWNAISQMCAMIESHWMWSDIWSTNVERQWSPRWRRSQMLFFWRKICRARVV